MKIWHISDTHTNQAQIKIPKNIDIVIHTGDATNSRNPFQNEPEMIVFLTWYAHLPIRHKVLVAGNHDTSIEKHLVTKEQMKHMGITYLFNETVEIKKLKIWGSPYTSEFGDWAFMKSQKKRNQAWDSIPGDVDIIATHGPPLGILDITDRRDNLQEQCGDYFLMNRIKVIKPKASLFGHIHNTKNIHNSGTKQVAGLNTVFSNGACVTDNLWGIITSHGNVIEL
jgi:Icc-related predicted phosphoesterase